MTENSCRAVLELVSFNFCCYQHFVLEKRVKQSLQFETSFARSTLCFELLIGSLITMIVVEIIVHLYFKKGLVVICGHAIYDYRVL